MSTLTQTLQKALISERAAWLGAFAILIASLTFTSNVENQAYLWQVRGLDNQIENIRRGNEQAVRTRTTIVQAIPGTRSSAPTRAPRQAAPPPFECAIMPFGSTPEWGAMHSASAVQRPYRSIPFSEHAAAPEYDMAVLTEPLSELNAAPRTQENVDAITAKFFYSTRYLAGYDLDAAEFSATTHPAIDIKMPAGTPVRSIAGGRVHAILNDREGLGLHIIIEHRLPDTSERVFSIYGHLQSTTVAVRDDITTGQLIGTVGSSGNSTNPHLHLQIDRDRGLTQHKPYVPPRGATQTEITRMTIHPVDFIRAY